MKQIFFAAALMFATSQTSSADQCHDRFSDLLVNGNDYAGPVRLHITQEIVGARTTLNYHYSDGEGNGMTEMIDPVDDPWSLFVGDNMYMSTDKGNTWKFINSFDAEKNRENAKVALSNDLSSATDVKCGEEILDGTSYEIVEGNYIASAINGADIYEKLWVDPTSGWIAKSYRHMRSPAFESKTTQVVEAAPEFVLPTPN